MTEGHGTCGQPTGGSYRPQRGRTTSILAPVRPLRGRLESVFAIRRFHSLRSFHQRLFTFAPFGDGRMALAKLQLMKIRMRLILYQHILILKYMSLLPLRRLAEFIHQMHHRIAWQGVVPFLGLALAAHLIHGAREILENIKGLGLQRQLAFAERTG